MESPKPYPRRNYSKFCEECLNNHGRCEDEHDTQVCLCLDSQKAITGTNCAAVNCIGRLCTVQQKVAGLGVPSLAIVAAILVIIVYVLRRRKVAFTKIVPNASSRIVSSERAQSLSSRAKSMHCFTTGFVKEFSLQELQQATACFSEDRMIGDGGFGAVYEGRLNDGRKVAVKRLFYNHFRRMELFWNELQILSTLDHPNLVKLYGFCCEDERDLLLVFEYVTNGSMSNLLYDGYGRGFSWNLRLNVALETADALSYLHNSINPPILHRDVKSTNILLDEKFHAKLADFGLSRLVPLEASHISTAPQGTPGYLDPDYYQSYQLTDKSDVYSFGVVLIELVTAKRAVDMSRDRKDINLSQMAITRILSGTWHELVDPHLEMHNDPAVEIMVKGIVELAFRCLAGERDERPKMRDVAEELARIKETSSKSFQTSIDMDKL